VVVEEGSPRQSRTESKSFFRMLVPSVMSIQQQQGKKKKEKKNSRSATFAMRKVGGWEED
jgi:hypothetical protein